MNSQQFVEKVVAPLTIDEFLSTYYEKKPVLLAHNDRPRWAPWLTLDSFIETLTGVDASLLKLRSAREGKVNDDITLQRALDDYRAGGTVVINLMHLVHPPMGRLCRLMEGFFHQNFQANAYFQPPGQKGFGAHVEIHDEFNFQMAGRKHWWIYSNPTELTTLGQDFSMKLPERCPLLFEAVTEPGDVMYIPRGYFHGAAATEDGPSLHATVGMVPLVWRDLLLQAIAESGDRHLALRRQVPLGPHVTRHFDAAAGLEDAIRVFSDDLRATALADHARRFALSRAALQPRFELVPAALQADTPVVRDALVIYAIERRSDHVALSFQGKALEFPLEAEETLRHLVEAATPICARALPGPLDEANRLRLVQYLYEQGLLTRREATP